MLILHWTILSRGGSLTYGSLYGNIGRVRILGRDEIDRFAQRHAEARKRLASWDKVVTGAKWRNFAEMKHTFNSVDFAGGETIFEIGGNNFRLRALVDYEAQTVAVTEVMTHAEYSKRKSK